MMVLNINKNKDSKLFWRILWQAGILTILLILLSAVWLVNKERNDFSQSFKDEMKSLDEIVSDPLLQAIYNLDNNAIEKIGNGLLGYKDISRVMLHEKQLDQTLFDSRNKNYTSYIKAQMESGNFLNLMEILPAYIIEHEDPKRHIQYALTLYPNYNSLQQSFGNAVKTIVFTSTLNVIILFICIFFLINFSVIRPIANLTEIANKIKNGDRLACESIDISQKDELGALAESIKSMSEELIWNAQTLEHTILARTSELEASRNRLVENEKMAALGSMVSGLAHEVNTPLGCAVTISTTLNESYNNLISKIETGEMTRNDLSTFLNNGREGLDIMSTNLDRAAHLISSFKMIAVDQSVEDIREINLREYISSVLQSINGEIKHKLSVDLDCPNDYLVRTIPGGLAQVVTNMTMNCFTHAYEKGEKGQFHIKFNKLDGSMFRIEFIDHGKGISENDLKKIFEPFWTTKRGEGGSGLGLSISYNLVVRKLGGTMTVSSIVGQGTRFTIDIPRRLEIPINFLVGAKE